MSKSDSTYNSYLQACPCGFYGDPVKECSCSAMAIARYQKKISGPLLDRIDIHVEVPRVDYEKLADKRQAIAFVGPRLSPGVEAGTNDC